MASGSFLRIDVVCVIQTTSDPPRRPDCPRRTSARCANCTRHRSADLGDVARRLQPSVISEGGTANFRVFNPQPAIRIPRWYDSGSMKRLLSLVVLVSV